MSPRPRPAEQRHDLGRDAAQDVLLDVERRQDHHLAEPLVAETRKRAASSPAVPIMHVASISDGVTYSHSSSITQQL